MGKDTLTIIPPKGFVLEESSGLPEGFIPESSLAPPLTDFDPNKLFDDARSVVDTASESGLSVPFTDENQSMITRVLGGAKRAVGFTRTMGVGGGGQGPTLLHDIWRTTTELPENLKIGGVSLLASIAENLKRRGMQFTQLTGLPAYYGLSQHHKDIMGIKTYEDMVRDYWEVFRKKPQPPLPPPIPGLEVPFGADLMPITRQRRLAITQVSDVPLVPGAFAGATLETVAKMPDLYRVYLRQKQGEMVAKQGQFSYGEAPITRLSRLVIQSGVPSYGVSLGVSLLTQDYVLGLFVLGETSGGQGFQQQLDSGSGLVKAGVIGELIEGAEIGGELLVFPKVLRAVSKGIPLREALVMIAENAGQEGVTGFTQTFLEVFGTLTSKGTPIKEAAQMAAVAAVKAVPENTFVGGALAGGAAGVGIVGKTTLSWLSGDLIPPMPEKPAIVPAPPLAEEVPISDEEYAAIKTRLEAKKPPAAAPEAAVEPTAQAVEPTATTPQGETVPAAEKAVKQWTVTVQQDVVVGGRTAAEPINRYLTIQAKTAAAARKAVIDSGEQGRIVNVESAKQAPAPEGKIPGGRGVGGMRPGSTIFFSPEVWADALKAGRYHIQKGAKAFAEWSAKMLADFGDPIKPHLTAIWDEIHGVKKEEKVIPSGIPTKASQTTEDIGALIEDIEKPPIEPPRKKAVPPKGEKKERGFITSVKEEFPDLETRVAGEYVPRSTDRLSMKAHTLILEDIDTAERMARTGANDEAVAVASELIKHYNEKAQAATDDASRNTYYDKAADIANTVAPTLTELGRAVQAATILARLTPEGQLRFAAQAISKYNEQVEKTRGGLFGLRKKIPGLTGEQSKDILTRMKKVQDMPDGPEKAMAFWELQQEISMLIPSTWYNKIVNLWKAGLLTGIKTSGLNTIANLSHGVSEVIKDIPGVAVDKVASLFTKERTLAFTGRGLAGGIVDGFKKGWRYLVTGYDARQVGTKFDFKRVNYGKGEFAKWAQAYEEAIFGLLGAEDQPFYYGAKARSLFSQAIAQAKTRGLKGAEAAKFINTLLENPSNDMLKYAMIDAETAVFVNRTILGNAAKMLQRVPGVEFVIPFARTPSAIAMQIINYSPVGAIRTVIENVGKGRFDQRLFSQGMGRSITGTAALAVGGALLKAGLLTLGRPKSEREKKLWELEGRKENSILVDGKWRSVGVLGPIGNVLVIGGYFAKGLADTGSPTKAIAQAISGGLRSFSEETYLAGLRRTLDAMEDLTKSSELWFSSLAGSFVPTIVADIARAGDSTERRTVGPIQRIEGRIPGLRNTLPPKVDVFGQDLPRYGGNVLEVMIDPTRPAKVNQDVVVDELRRLWDNGIQSSPILLGDKAGYKELTEDQNTRLWRRAGTLTYQAIFNRIHTPEYKRGYSPQQSAKVNDAIRGQIIETITRQAQNQARWEMVKELESQGVSMDYLKTTDLFPIPIGEIPLMIMQEQIEE